MTRHNSCAAAANDDARTGGGAAGGRVSPLHRPNRDESDRGRTAADLRPEATCTDTPLLAPPCPLASCTAVHAAAPAAGTTFTTTPSAPAHSTVRHNLQLGQRL